MDYDDNDYEGQNLQLSGEESSKFSPVLRPYALPKFDFDDSLQGHLRFDSLVENEVFLGIPSQEDSQWIEDFSRGNSGIEFSSSAADTCSISRRNNVWSEATSSESVEMLLKSVGQGEMVPGETIIEESDVCDELGSLTKQMEHNSNQDDRVEDIIDPEPALPPDEFCDELGSLTKKMEHSLEQVDRMEDIIEPEPTLPPDDSQDELGSLAKQMEHSLKQDGRVEDIIIDSEPTLPPDEFQVELGSLTKQVDHNSKQDDRVEDIIDPEPALRPDEFQAELDSLTNQMDHNSKQDDRVEDIIDPEPALPPDELQDELGSLATQVDHNSKQDDRVEDIIDHGPALPPDGIQLGSLTKQTDHNLKHVDRVEDIIDPEPALPPDEFRESFSGLNLQSQGAKIPSPTEGLSEMDPITVSEKSGSFIAEKNLEIDRECDDPNQMEVDTSVHVSSNNKILEDPPVSRVQIGSDDSSLQNVIASVGELNDQEIPHQVNDNCFENANTLSEDICEGEKEYNLESQEATTDEQMLSATAVGTPAYNMDSPHCASPIVESVKIREVEASTSKIEQISSLPLKGDCDVHIAEGSSEEVYSMGPSSSKKCEVIDLSRDTETNDHVEGNAYTEPPNVFQGDSSFDGHTVEVSSTKAKNFAHQELKMGSPMQTTDEQSGSTQDNDCFLSSESAMDRGVSARSSEEFIMSVDNKPFKQGDDNHTNNAGDLANKVDCSSAELLGKEHTNDNINEGNEAPGVHEDSNVDDHALPPKVVVSMQMCERNLLSEQGNGSDSDQIVSLPGKRNANLPTEMEFEVGSLDSDKRGDGSPPSVTSMEENVVTAQTLEFDAITREKPAFDFEVRNTSLASCDTLGAVSVTTADEVIDHKEHKLSAHGLGVIHQDKQDGMEVEVSIDPNLSTLKESSQVASFLGPVSEVDKVSSDDSASEKLRGMVDQVVGPEPIVETGNGSDQIENAAMANEVGRECFEKLQVSPVLCDSTVKEGDGAKAIAFENHNETTIERNYKEISAEVSDSVLVPNKGGLLTEPTSLSLVETTMASGVKNSGQVSSETKVDTSNDHQASVDLVCSSEHDAVPMLEGGGNSADFDKPICNSPTVISCIGVSHSDRDNQKEFIGAMVENVPPSEGTGVVDGKAQSRSPPSRGNDASKEERSFTFEVSPLIVPSEGETGKGWQSFPTVQACKISTIVEGSPSTSDGSQIDPKTAQKISRGSPQVSDGGITHGGSKGTPERKTRRGSGKAVGKENAKKGNHGKETPVRQLERGDKPCGPMSPLGSGQLVQLEDSKPYGNVERSGAKSCGLVSIPTSNLPDLNTSVPPALLQQPFTDLQQVQLRAQIFVYGSLIQGAAPDEAYMVAAFGQSDGTRSFWEPAWRAYFERLHDPKSHVNNSESPAQFRSGTRTPDQAVKRVSLQNKALSSPVGRASSKLGTPSAVANPIIPLSSPLWNLPTPPCDAFKASAMPRSPVIDYHQAALSPMNPFQGPMRNFVGHSPSWLPQASFPGPQWVASPQTSPFDANARFSRFPVTEAVKLNPVKESPVPISSSTKNVSPIPVAHSGGPSIFDVKKVTASPGQDSADLKTTRKRKKVQSTEDLGQISLPAQTQIESVPSYVVSTKVSVTEDLGQISLLAQSKTESVSAPVVSGHFSTPVAVTSPACFASKSSSGNFLSSLSPTPLNDHSKGGDAKVIISEESSSKIEEAKLQAEDAATHAATAISHCQGVWSQLDKQKNSGLGSDVEAKLVSAAVAIAAATSVAKAAAAAAKIASNVAVQAKLMAEEAVAGNSTHGTTIALPDIVNSLGNATPATILKGGDGSKSSSSIIFAAREAVRKRVEAASAASKHAENLDALVKAAELAAEAVSQAGKIVAMGDPLPLSELVDLGPDGYWRSPQVPSEQGVNSNIMSRDQPKTNSVDVLNVSAKQPNEGPKEISRDSKEDYLGVGVVDGISGSVSSVENDSRGQKGRRVSDLAKTIGVVPESEFGSRSTSIIGQDEHDSAIGSSKDNSINEGSFVEVFKDDSGNCKAAWFSAKVLKMTDGKALVCYTELQSDYGSGKLEEWVPLDDERNKVPKIRIAHPMTTVHFEGTRKRRRAAMADNAWSVGDRVDAWVQDSWREGIVSDKNQKDETTLTVNFPAQGETSVVRSWHLRPTLVWKDEEWIEWSSSRDDRTSQGDTPREKRLKPGSPAIEGKGKDTASKKINIAESGKHEEARLLHLSTNEKVFNVGQNTRGENRLEAHRTMRAGLQKEGSGVIYGVPKPKRKFMEVSKHYTSERGSKGTPANDSVKFARYLMPQGSRWKSSSKVETKEKESVEPKPRVPRFGKPQIGSGRTIPQKDSTSNEESGSGRPKSREFGSSSNTEKGAIGPISFSSRALPPESRSKKMPLSNAKAERLNNGRLVGNSSKGEVKDKSTPEVVEPRRSNRRIQPTSRLLEGLQTSLIVSKIPAISHDKSHKSQNRGTPRGGNSNHG